MQWKKFLVAACSASLMLAVATQTLKAQTQAAPRPKADTTTQHRAPDSGGSVTVPGHNRGFTGIHFTGTPARDANGHPVWADYTTVSQVAPDSPAAKAGILVGDVILSVNGVDGHTVKLLGAKEPGETFVIRIRRGTELREFTIVSTALPKT